MLQTAKTSTPSGIDQRGEVVEKARTCRLADRAMSAFSGMTIWRRDCGAARPGPSRVHPEGSGRSGAGPRHRAAGSSLRVACE
jgi:hypothetical protein